MDVSHGEYYKVKMQLTVLNDIVKTYPTSSIPNVIQQLESRLDVIKIKNENI